ncbi:Na(+)/H(+) antiporter [Methanosarcina mazei Go1]|uniref:Na(+)/H(+) antiporter n=2 Tax=Methanosarcina mazei TaxID=2209 RepID=Q8PVS1_METMA|nr:Na(+)/H(+) antiporter [Methanosarcina mazei Go1]
MRPMASELTTFVLIFGTLLFVFGLFSRKIEGTVVTIQMIFLAAGILLSPIGLNLISLSPRSGLVLGVIKVALVLTFFSDASLIGLHSLFLKERLSVRLLFLGLSLTICLGTVFAALLFADITFIDAILLGIILAPTDASLAQKVVEERQVPTLIRNGLIIESGLNDGAVMPLFIFVVALEAVEKLNRPLGTFLAIALEQIGFGIFVGIIIGLVGGWLFSRAFKAGSMSEVYYRTEFVALALISWLVADGVGGNGFIAAFIAGLATRIEDRQVTEEEVILLPRAEGNVLNLAVLFILGVMSAEYLPLVDLKIFAYAVLSLTVVRMVPVTISLIGSHLNIKTGLFMGWFGPRGLASIVLMLITVERIEGIRVSGTIGLAVITTVIISVFAHGITAGPVSNWYARIIATLPPDAPEKESVEELTALQGIETTENIHKEPY